MDAAAHHGAAFPSGRQRGRDQGAHRSENEGGVEGLRRALVGAAGPDGAETARESLRCLIARAGEGEDPPALMARDLGDDMRGRAEPIDADPLALPGEPQRAVTDEAGA